MTFRVVSKPSNNYVRCPYRIVEQSTGREIDSINQYLDYETLRRLKQLYEEFCLTGVKDHLMALPQATRSQRFDETRSAIRRAMPQLRRGELCKIEPYPNSPTPRASVCPT